MTRHLLDTSALLTLRDDEPGAEDVAREDVARLLRVADRSGSRCRICFISLMEILYRVRQDEGQTEARLAYEQCLSLPLMIVHEDALLLEKAAEVKATHRLSVADAWIAAAALLTEAILVHKDPEFEAVPVPQYRLPYK